MTAQNSSAGVVGLLLMGWVVIASGAQWPDPELLVTPEILKKNIEKPDWVVVDCRDLSAYLTGHIPGAISLGRRCDPALRDTTSRVYRDVSRYERLFSKVGIGNDTHVVFYYGNVWDLLDAAVAFWIMEYLGHDKVYVLNGGLDAWRKAGNRLDQKPTIKDPSTFKAKVVPGRYATTDEILRIAKGKEKGVQLIDSRTEREHKGIEVHSLRGGFIPNTTINVSHEQTLAKKKDRKTGNMEVVDYLDADAALKAFSSLDKSKRTISYCHSGARSAMTYLELRLLGFKDVANYDESWMVYGSQEAYPVENEQWFNFWNLEWKVQELERKIGALEAKKK
jgi:thiosulfate/3-mercaptopyruvate sulfurtransferase